MEITQSTVPGGGVLHSVRTRDGDRFRLLVDATGERRLFIDDPEDADAVLVQIDLEPDEADAIADILHSHPLADRVSELERRLQALMKRGP